MRPIIRMIFILFCALVEPAFSAEGARDLTVVPSEKRFALLIGVNDYKAPISPLKYCAADMKLLSETLQKVGFPRENIRLVTNEQATRSRIMSEIESICSLMDETDLLLVAFSGHGVMVDGKSYLCPIDTILNSTGTVDTDTLVSRERVYSQIDSSEAKRKLFFIDACRTMLSEGGKTLGGMRTLSDQTGRGNHGFLLMASCDVDQASWEVKSLGHGAFTWFLCQGIQGDARDEDGMINVFGLANYVSNKTKRYVYRNLNVVQVPTFRPSGEMTNFPIGKAGGTQSAGYHTAGEKKKITINGIEYTFCWCPAGTFNMGSPKSERSRNKDETLHEVTLTKGFWMLEHEVTQEMWISVMGNNPSDFSSTGYDKDRVSGSTSQYPVERVSWVECQGFIKAIEESAPIGLKFALPSEAQWEYACRAGTTTPFNFGRVLNGDQANCYGYGPYGTSEKGPYLQKPTPVKSYEPNAWGLYDMHGNVWEWCNDWYDAEYYTNSPSMDPRGPDRRSNRVRRGGGWGLDAWYCRSAYRGGDILGETGCIGFRLALLSSTDR